jgi:pyruvate formate lyase activating enzyme
MYRLTSLPATPVETLEKARESAREAGMEYVYIGNVPGHRGNSTYCPRCGTPLVVRMQFEIVENRMDHDACPSCGEKIPGLW